MTWASLGLDLDTATLPEPLTRELQARWLAPLPGAARTLVTCRAGALPPRPEGAGHTITVSNSETDVWLGHDELWIGAHLHLRLLPLAPGTRAELTAVPGPVPEAAWLLALVELQRLSGWLPLHAATVARDGQAVSVTGVSGAGKSTAALRLAGAGWTVVAEDQTWVHPESGRVMGLDRFLRTYPDSLERFAPHLRAQVQGQDAYGKAMLPLTPPTAPATLRALLVFGLPARPTSGEAVRAVWECAGVPLLARTRHVSADAVTRLLRRVSLRGTTRQGVPTDVAAALAP